MTTKEFKRLKLIEKIEHLQLDFILSDILDELHRAKAKFPEWPTDPIHCAAIVGEESGELLRAALQWKYENGILDSLHEESVQTAAMSIRFITQLSKFKHHENP